MMKQMLFLLLPLAVNTWAVPFEPQLDMKDYAKNGEWMVFNASAELGETGKPAPGYWTDGFYDPEHWGINSSSTVLPLTGRDSDGNKYVAVPGIRGLREYNLRLSPNNFYLPEAGEIEISFRMKITPDEEGVLHPAQPVQLDFRSRNPDRLHGPVEKRFPTLIGYTYRPTTEWKTYRFRTRVEKGDFVYSMMFRRWLDDPEMRFNTFCVDDISIRYLGKPAAVRDEIALIHSVRFAAYRKGETVSPEVRALLKNGGPAESVEFVCRKQYSHEIVKRIPVSLKRIGKIADGRFLYTGKISDVPKLYGAFELIPVHGGEVVPSKGNEFVVIHTLPAEVSPLRRRLGGHYTRGQSSPFQLSGDETIMPYRTTIDRYSGARLCQLSGLGHLMVPFGLKLVQNDPEKTDMRFIRAEIDLLRSMDLEVVGMLGGWFNSQNRRAKNGRMIGVLPNWLFQEKYRVGKRYLPGEKEWRTHVDSIIKEFGTDIRKWSVLCEPQWSMTAPQYLMYQKIAYDAVKKNDPGALLIAGDATSDQGYNLIGWLESLHKIGFERYTDCAAFNPYGSASDYMGGVRFRYSNLIGKMRKVLVPGTGLWQEELYYIPHSKRKQMMTNQWYFAGADLQRHYLLGLLHGLEGVTAIDPEMSLQCQPYVASEVLPALNALSRFLSGKTRVIVPEIGNTLVRAVIFADTEGKDCAAALWLLQERNGTLFLTEESKAVRFFDTYGNLLPRSEKMTVGLDPLFLTGTAAELKNLLERSVCDPGVLANVRVRRFQNECYWEADNCSGQKDIITIVPEGEKSGIRLDFTKMDRWLFRLDVPSIPRTFHTNLNSAPVPVQVMEDVPSYSVKADKEIVLKTVLGNRVCVSADADSLIIKASVSDTEIIPSGANIFEGDAVEIFLDRTPFHRLDSDKITNSLHELSISQKVFAVETLPGGKSRLFLNAVTREMERSDARAEVRRFGGGYEMTIHIPFRELNADESGVIGLNLEISRRGKDGVQAKDTLNGKGKASYCTRLHYPLFRLPDYAVRTMIRGQAASGRIRLLREPVWGPALRVGSFSRKMGRMEPGTYRLTFRARGRRLDHMKLSVGGSRQRILRGGEIPQEASWTCYNMVFSVPKQTGNAVIYFEFLAPRRDVDAWAEVEQIQLLKEK